MAERCITNLAMTRNALAYDRMKSVIHSLNREKPYLSPQSFRKAPRNYLSDYSSFIAELYDANRKKSEPPISKLPQKNIIGRTDRNMNIFKRLEYQNSQMYYQRILDVVSILKAKTWTVKDINNTDFDNVSFTKENMHKELEINNGNISVLNKSNRDIKNGFVSTSYYSTQIIMEFPNEYLITWTLYRYYPDTFNIFKISYATTSSMKLITPKEIDPMQDNSNELREMTKNKIELFIMDSDKLQNINEKQMIKLQALGILNTLLQYDITGTQNCWGGGGCYIYNYNFCNYA